MLAGAAGIDVVLLVVAADESVMPQTREHLDICRLLEVEAGVIAVTKSDLVDEETAELVRLEVSELVAGTALRQAPIIACSSSTGAGLSELVGALRAAASGAAIRSADGPLRLPIDRSFTLRGFGSVVTGTAMGGHVVPGDEVELLPAGRLLRVRGVQVHGSGSEEGVAGQRVAVNLGGIEHREIERGDVLVKPGSHCVTSVLDVRVDLLADAPDLDDLARVRVHVGTAEVMARLRWANGGGLGQLRLEAPIVAAAGDRFILRRYSPITTIGGGRVLHPAPAGRLRPSDTAAADMLRSLDDAFAAGGREAMLPRFVDLTPAGVGEGDLAKWTGLAADRVRRELSRVEHAGRLACVDTDPHRWVGVEHLDAALARTCARLKDLHVAQPLIAGHPRPALRAVSGLDEAAFAVMVERGLKVGRLVASKDLLSLTGHAVTLTDDERRALDTIVAAHRDAGLSSPDLAAVLASVALPRDRAQRLVKLLLASGELVRVKDGMLVHGAAMAALLRDMASWYPPGQSFSVPDFKDRSATSRKHAIPLLEYLDSQGLSRRVGEGRVWNGPGGAR
jgi:selenocysteine-specific elongation factor